MTLSEFLFEPFATYGFMRRALVGCVALSIGSVPLGLLLIIRRMSLMGDAMAHAILPGAAVAFLFAGLSLWSMTIGGVVAGLTVALLAGLVSRVTPLREDASFAAFYLISLGLGVLLVSTRGSNVDLMHVLFGTVLALDDASILLIAVVTTLTVTILAIVYRLLVAECFNPGFLRAVGGAGRAVHLAFLTLVVLNLVSGFQALGTLMVVGIMMLPAAAARFWSEAISGQFVAGVLFGIVSSVAGLLASYHAHLPSSPAIILGAGAVYALSVLIGPRGSILSETLRLPHLQR
ncbi:metal ABC transporter permease [Amorphus orientalis]|uniref:Zinc/manganese transport system permease protein n=1 Tax=Amorphus orientalis TaxID=649198 RepID=A0AAE3VMV3_9HYPH|nr:metal ABC transporter permease [Amorphus orientalis]MDQ0315034.1 zinc/manganese transport system permease protein [Amorphus orientalis]